MEEERERADAQRRQVYTFAAVAAQFLDRHVKGEAFRPLEQLARELRSQQPKLKANAGRRTVRADPRNEGLAARAKRQSIAKTDEAERILRAAVRRSGVRPIEDIHPHEVAAFVRTIVEAGLRQTSTPCDVHQETSAACLGLP